MTVFLDLWWRKITANDLFNIEKPLPPGPKGQLHLDVPNVQALHSFFGIRHSNDPNSWKTIDKPIRALKSPEIESHLVFRPRPKNNRYDIRLQNINSESSERHPAWTSAFGWPAIHGIVRTRDQAEEILRNKSIYVVILRSTEQEYFADFFLDLDIPRNWPKDLASKMASGGSAGHLIFDEPLDLSVENANRSLVKNEESKTARKLRSQRSVRKSKRVQVFDLSEFDEIPTISSPRERVIGRGLTSQEKSAVEQHAVRVATRFLELKGFENIKDVGKVASYDLICVKDGQVHIGEVKGTSTDGAQVNLTKNEVEVHTSHHPHNMLIIVSGIELERGPEPSAGGGEINFFYPWKIDVSQLTVISYQYQPNFSDSKLIRVSEIH